MTETQQQLPWYRQFWPWFIISMLGASVVASLTTVWIAVAVAPDRVDGPGLLSIPLEWSGDNLRLDLGIPPHRRDWPNSMLLTIESNSNNSQQTLRAVRVDDRHFEMQFAPLEPGRYSIKLEADDAVLTFVGTWSYPAQVWKMQLSE